MGEQLPSYREATRRFVLEDGKKAYQDVFDLAVPHIDPRDYYNLCLVSRDICAVFSPLLTKNPIRMIRTLGMLPERGKRCSSPAQLHGRKAHADCFLCVLDPRWYFNFVNRFLETTETSKSEKFITMDFREFRAHFNDMSNSGNPAALTTTVLRLMERSSDMRCLVLDGRTDLEVALFAREQDKQSFRQVRLFSMANCQVTLPAMFFGHPDLQSLVYLDISNNKMWRTNLVVISKTFTPLQLPHLRILKLKGLGISSSMAALMLELFRWQLWSIDLSGNNISADFMDQLVMLGVRRGRLGRLQTDEHFQVEGNLRASTDPVRGFYFVDESASSATFSHADRYLADPPTYTVAQDDHDDNLGQPRAQGRLTGTEAIRGDSLEDTMQALDGGPFRPIPSAQETPCDDIPRTGFTHLHLNDLNFSSRAVERLLMYHSGYIEHFECNRGLMMYGFGNEWLAKTPWLSSSYVLYGFPGASYLFRPVFQSNLRVLKIHHSLVTNVPTLVTDGNCVPENLWLAETRLRERMDLAYPQTYVPDMNPRLHSLTLSKVPRLSTGVVIKRLITFLKLAAAQEQGIEQTRRAITHHRGATVLRGLRHIRIEFDFYPTEELQALGSDEDVAEAMNELSIVSESAWDASSRAPGRNRKARSTKSTLTPSNDNSDNFFFTTNPVTTSTTTAPKATQPSAPVPPDYDVAQHHAPPSPDVPQRLTTFPFDHTDTEYYSHAVQGGPATALVWIGPGFISERHPPAVSEYMRILASSPRFAHVPTAATPCHVAAGVPAGALVFGRAWDYILVPPTSRQEIKKPTAAELRGPGGLRDVLEALKSFRRESRARYHAALADARREGVAGGQAHHPHDYWKGRLDIELAPAPAADSAEYWR